MGLRKTERFRGAPKKRALIHDLFEFALQNFNALDDFFHEMGLNKGCQLSEFDFRRALTRLECTSPSASEGADEMILETCEAQMRGMCKFEMSMLRTRYLKH